MVIINPKLASNILNLAANSSKDNGINTILSTTTNLVRGGVVMTPGCAPPNMNREEKASTASYMVASTVGSILTQMGVYKVLDCGKHPILSTIGVKRFGYEKFAKNLNEIQKFKIDEAFNTIKGNTTSEILENVTAKVSETLPKRAKSKTKLFKENLSELVKKLNDGKELAQTGEKAPELIKKALNMTKDVQGSKELLKFIFGVGLFTGFIVPTVICKNINPMLNWANKHIKIGGKSIVPRPAKKDDQKNNKNELIKLVGLPIAVSAAALTALHITPHNFKLKNLKIGQMMNNMIKKGSKWDNSLDPNKRIIRNSVTNFILRPISAMMTGNPFLAAYLAANEVLTFGVLSLNTKNLKNIIKFANKKFKLKGDQARGMEFIATHAVQTYLMMGAAVGIASNYLSGPLKKAISKVMSPGKQENIEESSKLAKIAATGIKNNNINIKKDIFADFLNPAYLK